MSEQPVLILGIETSCDETAAAVVADGRTIRSSVIASQADLHRRYGGVVPEVASRLHVASILPVIDQALDQASCGLHELAAIAVTSGPGLIGALLVGVSAAKGLSLATGIPLVPVHHLAGHIAANYLADPTLEPPFLCLVVSGAHTHLVAVEDYEHFRVLGQTRDDAAGEAFDKIARVIGLGYPGGPRLDRLAESGQGTSIDLPRTRFADSCDFSFSGLKTAALNQWQKASRKLPQDGPEIAAFKADLAASVRQAIVQTLLEHTEAALSQTGLQRLAVAGGVAANSLLRTTFAELAARRRITLSLPPLELCTDNAAMIAAAGYHGWTNSRFADLALNATANWPLDQLQQPGRRKGTSR